MTKTPKTKHRAPSSRISSSGSKLQPNIKIQTRLNILPDPAFLPLQPALAERLARIAANLTAGQMASLLDPLMRRTLEQGFADAGAHEGTVWIVDEPGGCLVPALNTGPQSEKLVGKFRQPLNAGLICMVFASEQPFLENEVWKNAQQSKLLDSHLQTRTYSMIAVPFYFLKECRGVISCVQLKKPGSTEPDPPGFNPAHLMSVQRAAALVSQLIEYRLLGSAVGWTNE